MRLSLIIPFYQKEPGLLARALQSVAAQTRPEGLHVRALIVDDASPLDPSKEISEATWPAWMTCEIIRRSNGGPGAARNTGLDAAADSDFVAFLDSDDVWEQDHLARAIEAFDDPECDLYFCDSQHDEETSLFPLVGFPAADTVHTPRPSRFGELFEMTGTETLSSFLRCYASHTSTVVFRQNPAMSRHRFDPELRIAGEDHAMWVDLANDARRTVFSTYIGSARGHGVDVYRSVTHGDWVPYFHQHGFQVIKNHGFLKRFDFEPRALASVERSLDNHNFEVFRSLLRPAGLKILRDATARRILRRIYPDPWANTFRYLSRWRRARRAHKLAARNGAR